jgi:PAS domain S-box-containing protein
MAIAIVIAVAYVAAARFGFQFAFAAEQVTTVWAPTGLSIAALLLWGQPMAGAVWTGAFVANAMSDAPAWTAVAIASGNTLEAMLAAYGLRRFAAFDPILRRIRDVVALFIIGGVLATTVSASIGVSTLCAAGVQPWSRFATLWLEWWVGDALGAVVVAPVILTMARRPAWSGRQWTEALLLVGGAMAVTHFVFRQVLGPASAFHPLEYVIFPFVAAAAVRGGPAVTSLTVLGTSAVAIWHTVNGTGPYAGPLPQQSLVLLQAFSAVLAGTSLLLAAAIAERATGEQRRAAALAVGEILAGAGDLESAGQPMLQAICNHLEWQCGALWMVDTHQDRLTCVATWRATPSLDSFARETRELTFARGIGLPGRVWQSGRAAWIENVLDDDNFPRARLARAAGLHGAFAFPVCVDEHPIGVIECFNRTVMTPDPDLLRTLGGLGTQVGLFVARRRQEAALREGQRRTSAILETALDAVIGMDHRGVIIEFNPAATRIFGYARDAALGRELADLLIPPALREQHRAGLQRYLATGVGPFIDRRIEAPGCHADGHEFPVEVAITRVTGDDPPTFTGYVRDLTARVRAEQEREDLLAREAKARSEAETANRAKDEFLATLSHELRTPLNAIVGWTHMLRDGTLDAEGTARALDVIARNANLQTQLIADILDVSRIITGGVRLAVRPVELTAIVAAALDVVRPAAAARQVQLRSMLAPGPRMMQGDAQRLQQVIWNLLSNAVKFTDAGGVVSVELDATARDLHVLVRDTGVGIDPAFLPYVFERFRQADGATGRQQGLGLGLSIVKHLVELHGGTVRADSPGPGRGSTFVVSFPRAATDVDIETSGHDAGDSVEA